jgi:hypothetical protein
MVVQEAKAKELNDKVVTEATVAVATTEMLCKAQSKNLGVLFDMLPRHAVRCYY